VHHFSSRFNKVYHSILVDIRSPPGLAHLRFPYAFNPEMAFQLRERNNETLEEMQNVVVDVQVNLLNKKTKLEALMKDKIEKEQTIS